MNERWDERMNERWDERKERRREERRRGEKKRDTCEAHVTKQLAAT
jgi:hypothetical protein